MSQSMSLTSLFFNSENKMFGSKDQGSGYIRLPSLPKDENHFVIWKLKAEAVIRGAGLMSVLEYPADELQVRELKQINIYRKERDPEQLEKKDPLGDLTQEQKDIIANRMYKVYAILAETLVTADQMRILLNKKAVPEGNAYALWKAIKDRYDIRTSDATKERLWEIFNGLKMNQQDDFKAYKAKVEEAAANLFSVDEEVPDNRIKAKLITGLTSRYSAFVGALYTQDYSTMKMNELCKKINDFEESTVFKNTSIDTVDPPAGLVALFNDYRQKAEKNNPGNKGKEPFKCFTCHMVGHRAYDCDANKDKKKCINCKRIGHIYDECRFPKKAHLKPATDPAKDNIKEKQDYGFFFAPVIPYDQYATINKDTWILDSGASRHLCTQKEKMKNWRTPTQRIEMKCANTQTVTLDSVGETTLLVKNSPQDRSMKLLLKNVVFAPTFACNIISVGKLVRVGAQVIFGEKGAMVFTKEGKMVLTAVKMGQLFIVRTNENFSSLPTMENIFNFNEINPVESAVTASCELWHNRLGHLGISGLKNLLTHNAVDGLNCNPANIDRLTGHVCGSCMKGKQHRNAFGYEWKDKAEEVMDRIHGDLCGPVLNGQGYLSDIIDEKSRYIFGQIIQTKDEATDGIIHWHNKAKRVHGKPAKEFHTDGGGEYRSKELLNYFKAEGVEVTSTLPSTPQHNGIAERANRTIFESARSLLSHCQLPKVFWGDAVLYAIHIRNRCLTTSDKNKTPYELWTGKKPSVSHIRVFGCDAFMHIKDSDRKKLDPKSARCVLLGYSEYYHGYKLYNTENNKVCYSRDVRFNENEFTHAAKIKGTNQIYLHKAGNPLTELMDINPYSILVEPSHAIQSEPGLVDAVPRQAHPNNNSEMSDNELDEQEEENQEDELDNPEFESEIEEENPEFKSEIEEENQNDENQEEQDEFVEFEPSNQNLPNHNQESLPPQVRLLLDDRQHAAFADPTSEQRSRTKRILHNVGREISNTLIETNEEQCDYCFITSLFNEPQSYQEAIESEDAVEWKKATDKEYQSLIDNKTWVKVKLPNGRSPIGCKWVYKLKLNQRGEIERYKARLVAKGYSQKEGIDYFETFAPVLKYKSLRILLSLAAIMDMEVKQMDVETAFLNAEIKEEVYMKQPEGFSDGDPSNVYRLLKTLYGTKQAPHEWNNTLNEFILSLGFTRCKSDTCTYIKFSRTNQPIIIGIFVDDIIILYKQNDELEWLESKNSFMNAFKMKDLNDAEWILGIRVIRDRTNRTIKLDHEIQINKTLEIFRMTDCNPVKTPSELIKLTLQDCPTTEEEKQKMNHIPFKSLVGSLQYIALSTRPDISYAVNQLSRYLSNPGPKHWQAAKRVLRYLKGTVNLGLVYTDHSENQGTNVEIFCDADWAGELNDRKSTTGIVVKLNGCPIVWLSKKQPVVALSTAEAEYIAMSTAVQESIWINQYLSELGMNNLQITPILHSDNQAAIQIATNDTLHARSKHIDIRFHFIRDQVALNKVELKWISTVAQEADINTKALGTIAFERLRDMIGMK